jgi:hypothetical protein
MARLFHAQRCLAASRLFEKAQSLALQEGDPRASFSIQPQVTTMLAARQRVFFEGPA